MSDVIELFSMLKMNIHTCLISSLDTEAKLWVLRLSNTQAAP